MSICRRAYEKYQSEGLRSTLIAATRQLSNSPIGRNPYTNYVCSIQYLISPDYPRVKETKLYGKQFWYDRFLELSNYYGYPKSRFLEFYRENGLPNTLRFNHEAREVNQRYFGDEDTSPSPESMLEGYRRIHFFASNRGMLAYDRYSIARDYIEFGGRDIPIEDQTILDYGCGVADPPIYLNLYGANVDIVDLDTKVLDFASWRLDQRGIDHDVYRAEQTEEPVEVDKEKYGFIIMAGFLEHVGDPSVFLKFAIEKLKPGGILYDPVGREYTHDITEQHLRDAKEVVESEEYQRLHREHFDKMDQSPFWKRTSE